MLTPGWLDGLIGWARHEWPAVGLVGPTTNYASPPQQIAVDYQEPAGLDAFAARRRRDFRSKALRFERLSGFCLLARRDVLEEVGGFDERFGLGFFDDDDLCARVRSAGYQLLIALDVFVHHTGSRTFAGLAIDTPHQLQHNHQQFHHKWGVRYSAPYRPPELAPVAPQPDGFVGTPTAGTSAQKVSLCLIVKNEEANLTDCLRPVRELFHEVIVVDTGSTDCTREIAQELGARVFEFPWVDSFAAARNECLRHASGEWIFWLDADDRLDSANLQKLRDLFASLKDEKAAYVMKCRCLPDATGTSTMVDHVRLFRNLPGVRWERRVHEQVLGTLRQHGHTVRWADVVIQHTGYVEPALRGRKRERDLRLLHLELADQPDDPFTLFNLGSVYQDVGRYSEALPLLQRSLAGSQPTDSIVRKLYALIASCLRHLGKPAEALTTCYEGLRVCPGDAELLFLRAVLRMGQHDLPGAEADFLELLRVRPKDHFASIAEGLRGYRAHHNLGVLYLRQGRRPEAEQRWRAAVAERADFLPSWLELADLALACRHWAEVEVVASTLASWAPVESAVLRARVQLALRDFAGARALLEPVLAAHPAALWPHVILSHVLLQEGADPDAAERALRAILALDPQHAEARNNLAVLLGQRQQAAEQAWIINGPQE